MKDSHNIHNIHTCSHIHTHSDNPVIIAAGTFDHLHKGHIYFLETAFAYGVVMIGLCADKMITHKKFAEKIFSYTKRKHQLVEYLTEKGYTSKDYCIKKITDELGFAVTIRNIDAILVTPEVKENAKKINEVRKKKGWNPLDIVEIPLLKDEQGVISSTRMRESDKTDIE
ncbi:MAG: pantetheine-phosphate adenylyltransferase [Candidatus Methanofastidiosia archaeon]|jgi:pantetheine-phosphate adenylyltransferase